MADAHQTELFRAKILPLRLFWEGESDPARIRTAWPPPRSRGGSSAAPSVTCIVRLPVNPASLPASLPRQSHREAEARDSEKPLPTKAQDTRSPFPTAPQKRGQEFSSSPHLSCAHRSRSSWP